MLPRPLFTLAFLFVCSSYAAGAKADFVSTHMRAVIGGVPPELSAHFSSGQVLEMNIILNSDSRAINPSDVESTYGSGVVELVGVIEDYSFTSRQGLISITNDIGGPGGADLVKMTDHISGSSLSGFYPFSIHMQLVDYDATAMSSTLLQDLPPRRFADFDSIRLELFFAERGGLPVRLSAQIQSWTVPESSTCTLALAALCLAISRRRG